MKRHSFKIFSLPFVTLGLILTLVACQKSGGGSPAVTSNAYINSCPSCVGQVVVGPTLLSGLMAQTPDANVQMSLNLQAEVMQPCYQPPDQIVYCGSGPATLVGSMAVINSSLMCNAQTGNYVITTIENSQLNLGVMLGGHLLATGPNGSTILMRIAKGIYYRNDGQMVSSSIANNRLGLNLILESVNGISCGIMSLE